MALRYRIAHAICRGLGVQPPTPPQPAPASKTGRWRRRLGAIRRRARTLSASYGSSIAAHAVLLGALALVTIALPDRDREAVIRVGAPAPTPHTTSPLSHDTTAPRPALEPEPLEPVFEIADAAPAAPSVTAPLPAELPTQPTLNSLSARDLGLGAPASGGAYSARVHKRSLRREGGSQQTEAAVRASLSWLARHQDADGGWRVAGWQEHCEGEPCAGDGYDQGWGAEYGERHDVGLTALALLACLGNGHTQLQGTFKRTVRRALQYLKRHQRSDGSIGWEPGMLHTVYDHALATFALCEAYAVSRDFTLRRPAQRALDWAVAAQNPQSGWRYGIQPGESDTSVTGWFGLALAAGRKAKLDVPETAFAGIRTFFDGVTGRDGDAGYSAPGNGSTVFGPNQGRVAELPVNTAVVAACRQLLPRTRTRSLTALLDRIAEQPPRWADTERNYYYWYYGTYALFQAGGQRWRRWNQAMQDALLPHQRDAGCARGSWDAVGEWCLVGGRVYGTAINALTLEIYYRYQRR